MSVKIMSETFEAKIPDQKYKSKNGDEYTAKSSTLKLVLLALADHASDTGESVYPSIDLLMAKTSLSNRTCITALECLERMSIIAHVKNRVKGNKEYRINRSELKRYIQIRSEASSQLEIDRNEASSLPEVKPVHTNQVLEPRTLRTRTPGIETAPIPGIPTDDVRKVVGTYIPDEENKPVRSKPKCKNSADPKLFPWAQEISILCCMPLGNGSKNEIFRAAKLLVHGESPPRHPSDLRPIFAKGGKFFTEWRTARTLNPMDIPKHWPRLSGAVTPPEAAPDHATNADLLAQGYKL